MMEEDYGNIFDIKPDLLRHRLKEPIDVKRLLSGDGVSFELDEQPGFMPDDEMDGEGPFHDADFLEGLHECGLISDESDEEEEAAPDDPEAAERIQQRKERWAQMSLFDRKRSKMVDISEGTGYVFKRVVQPGEGLKVPDGALVYYHYRMYLEDVDEPFDSTRFRRRQERQRVGVGQLLEGMEIALTSMRKKERSVFLMHHLVMYGVHGCPPRIPPEAEIYAEIEVLDFVEKNDIETYFDLTSEEREQCPYEKVITVVKQCRNDGNTAFRNGRYQAAVRKYMRSRDVLNSVFVKDEEEDNERNKELVKILLNLSICFKKLNRGPMCIKTCNQVLEIDSNNVKAHYLKGVALSTLSEFEKATESLRRANQLRPHDREILKAITENNQRAEKFLEIDRMQCRRMFGVVPESAPGPSKKETPTEEDLSTEFAKRLSLNLDEFLKNPKERTYPDFDTKSLSKREVMVLAHIAKEKSLAIHRDGTLWSLRKK